MSLSADESLIGAGMLVPPGRAVENSDMAALLDRLADLLEIEGAYPFRGAYRTAAGPALHDELGITTLDQLAAALRAGRVHAFAGRSSPRSR